MYASGAFVKHHNPCNRKTETMNAIDTPKAVDRPSRIAIARCLAAHAGAIVEFEGDAGNYERHQAQVVAARLGDEPPSVAAAAAAAEAGVSHAWRGHYVESRFEAWTCAAVAELLREPETGRIKLPSADDLGRWVDLLGVVVDELTGTDEAPAPAPGTEAATLRAFQLTTLRLWLLGALHIRVQTDAGRAAGDDPDALPIG